MTTGIFMGLIAIAQAVHKGPIKHQGILWMTGLTDLLIIAALLKWVLLS